MFGSGITVCSVNWINTRKKEDILLKIYITNRTKNTLIYLIVGTAIEVFFILGIQFYGHFIII